MSADVENLTQLIRAADEGRPGAADRLMEAVYDDLQRMAAKHLRERFGTGLPGVTLEPAALVNESFMKLIRQRKSYDNSGHFFAIATRVMLRVLVDYQRRRRAACRGGDLDRVTLWLAGGVEVAPGDEPSIEVETLTEALERLETLDTRKSDVVKLRIIWGLEMKEIATALGISLATVERDWSFAKAWLARETQASD